MGAEKFAVRDDYFSALMFLPHARNLRDSQSGGEPPHSMAGNRQFLTL